MSRKEGKSAAAQLEMPATERVYTRLKELILENELKPGEPVPFERLVRQWKVSRTPLREAILRLERERLIEIKPRQGTFVSHLDLRQIREMYQVRRILEAEAAREAALRVSEEKIAELVQILKRFDLTSARTDWAQVSAAGHQLHLLILNACGNQVLQRTLRELQDHFRRFRNLSLALPQKVRSSHEEHLAIAAALRDRDAAAAHRLVSAHFEHASQFLVESLLSGDSPLRLTVNAAS